MSDKKTFSISLPYKNETKEVSASQSIIVVGANGSGKTRLGTWIELNSAQKEKVHRISAQKSLYMPDSAMPISMDLAESSLLFGYDKAIRERTENRSDFKRGNKWQGKPAVTMLNDYEKLMTYLFSDYTEESTKYLVASEASKRRVKPPETKLKQVKEIWEKILPHRELIIDGLRIQTCIKSVKEKKYSPTDMSDGERVIFYLIGQCLAAPKDGIIVIDEPEIHLHKSIQFPLWAEIEKSRHDCSFIYLTHDVNFAAAQEGAERIWLKSYDGIEWDWELIQPDQNLPDELIIEVLGSRRSVVFVEGENGSYDVSLYREILSNFLVIPKGNCTQVIQTVKAMKANSQFHHLDVYGIIDLDRRVPEEIYELEKSSIFVLNVAEVENLFCTKEILNIFSKQLRRDPDADFQVISDYLFLQFQSDLETQVSLRVISEIKFQFNKLDEKTKGVNSIKLALGQLTNDTFIDDLYESVLSTFNDAINTKNYDKLLALYNRKKLPIIINKHLNVIGDNNLPEFILRLARDDKDRVEITNALKKYFGKFASKM